MIVVKVRYHGQHFLASCRATLCVQVAKLCCPHYHPRKQHQNLLPKVEPSSTSCNMLLQLATLKFVARQVACRVVIRATKLCNLQSNNVARQVARKCCPYYRTLTGNHTVFLIQFGINFHLWVFQKTEIALAEVARAISAFWKIHSCKLIPNWTRNRMIAYTYRTSHLHWTYSTCSTLLEYSFSYNVIYI